MNSNTLTKKQAHKLMFVFLAKQYELGCKELDALLGSMSLLEDDMPIDQALIRDWEEAIIKFLSGEAEGIVKFEIVDKKT